jgi:hypothetical protein
MYRYNPDTGTMVACPPAPIAWWRRLLDRVARRRRRRALTNAQWRQMLAFANQGDTGTERL